MVKFFLLLYLEIVLKVFSYNVRFFHVGILYLFLVCELSEVLDRFLWDKHTTHIKMLEQHKSTWAFHPHSKT